MMKLTKLAWDKAFKKEGKIFTKPQKDMARIVKFFKKQGVKILLDLGCGSGRHLVYLAKQDFDVYGIDIAKHGIKIAKDWLKEEGLRANLKIGDIYKKLPYKDNFFDAIISIRTLHHGKIEDIRRLIKEMERTLKPGGLIFITVRKEVAKKYIPREKLFGIKFIAPRTYIILGGSDKEMPHYRFNKEILRKEFKNFKIIDLWIEPESYYCLIGRFKKSFLNNLDNGKKIVDFTWLKNQAEDESNRKFISKLKNWYNNAHKGKYGKSKRLFSVKLGDYKIWLRRCSAHSSLDMYTDIFKYDRHFLLPKFSGKDAKIVIDGGACEGHYSLKIKQNNPSCKIIALEPNPLPYEILKKNVESNHLNNIIVVNKALDKEAGRIPFEFVEQVSSIGGKNMQIIKRHWLKKSLIKKTQVETTTLGELFRDYNLDSIDILKLDIQGMEMEVFKSSKNLLKRIHKIVIEWHTPKLRREIIKFFKKYRFNLVFEDKKSLGDLYFINKSFCLNKHE